jgi:hypothetical protein
MRKPVQERTIWHSTGAAGTPNHGFDSRWRYQDYGRIQRQNADSLPILYLFGATFHDARGRFVTTECLVDAADRFLFTAFQNVAIDRQCRYRGRVSQQHLYRIDVHADASINVPAVCLRSWRVRWGRPCFWSLTKTRLNASVSAFG